MLKHGILGLLNYGEMTGYEIREVFRNSLSYFWTAQSSQIYRELHTLEEKGFLTMQTVVQETRPDKKLCRITPAGQAELLRWLAEEGVGLEMKAPLLMKVFFLGERPREENLAYFRRLSALLRQSAAAIDGTPALIENYQQALGDPERALYWKMTADFGKRSLQMYVDWVENCIRLLETQRGEKA